MCPFDLLSHSHHWLLWLHPIYSNLTLGSYKLPSCGTGLTILFFFLGYLRGLCPPHLSKQKFEIPTSSLLKDGTRFSSSECAAASAKFSLQDQKYEICALEEKEIPCFPARSSTGVLVWTLQNLPGAVIMDFESFGMVKLEVTWGHFGSSNGSLWLHSWSDDNRSTDFAGEIWKTMIIKWDYSSGFSSQASDSA